VRGGRISQPPGNITTENMNDTKAILAVITVIAVILAGIWLDNNLPGFNPVETRQHP
jgi:hypothetical protein